MSAILNNESGAAHSQGCCWPGCIRAAYSEATPLCTQHFGEVGQLYKSECRRLGVGQNLTPSARWLAQRAADEAKMEERRKRRREAENQVYYVRLGDRIKIGYTKNIRRRMAQLRTHPRFVLAVEPGGPEQERLRHQEFAGLRDGRREEFFPHERLMRHIDLIRETYGPPRIT
jgi:hypothetical protein